MPSSEELKELTELMAECGLEDSALYKSYTVDTSSDHFICLDRLIGTDISRHVPVVKSRRMKLRVEC